MKFSEWKKVKLGEVIQFNPPETLKKGTIAKKVGMDKLAPYQKKINGYEYQEYKGGVKFRNGDTLFARITPSLENGKTAQVDILDEEEIGFGSTEFIVWREKEGKTINDFIYYLSISPEIRDVAIKSMTGTSGRQRVQLDALKNHTVILPPVEEQKAIADFLSSLDKKIEVNNQISAILEKISNTIFRHWFIDFEFPNENGEPYKSSGGEMVESDMGLIPKGWNVVEFGKIIQITSGKRPKKRTSEYNRETPFPLVGASSIMGYTNDYNYDEPILIIGRVGTHGVVQRFNKKVWASDNTLVIKSKFYEYAYQILQLIDYRSLNRGSTQPLITQKDIKNYKILLPQETVLNKFENLVSNLFKFRDKNLLENEKLVNLRDLLLPKLMSGEIRVPIESE